MHFWNKVIVVDIGNHENFGWAEAGCSREIIDNPRYRGINDCVDAIVDALLVEPLAVGFESPMHVPVRKDPSTLTRARIGEGNRAFSSSPGACVLVTGLVTISYLLSSLRKKLGENATNLAITFDWRHPPRNPRQLLLFEAFVSNQPNREHVLDALNAANAFQNRMSGTAPVENDITADNNEWLSLLGAILLRTGWHNNLMIANPLEVLKEECLVVRI